MRKSNLASYQIVKNGSMGANITSAVTNIFFLDNIGVQLNWLGAAGSAIGAFNVQVSADYEQDMFGNVTNAGNWVSIPLNPSPASASDNNSDYIDLNQLSAPWLRVTYTRTSGTGTLNAFIVAKVV